MFSKGSRYRNLPESSALTAQGERLRGKELRVIPPRPGRFLHLVRDGDRLDLLAFKYYGDPAKWWQIADANPEFEFPPDLLDRRPVVEERLALTPQGFIARFDDLLKDLRQQGEVHAGESSLFDDTTIPRPPDFLASTVVVIYPPATDTRGKILDRINQDFHLLRTFAWTQVDQTGANQTAEAFTFDDRQVKSKWQEMTATLASKPGMLAVQSMITEATLQVVYHSRRLSRGGILDVIKAHGFFVQDAQSAVLLRAGAKMIIPPNQIV